jgi:hypothetical protein
MPRESDGDKPHKMGEATVVRETDKAILVSFEDEDTEQRWIPKSVVHDDSEIWKKDDNGQLVVKTWWAEKNVL